MRPPRSVTAPDLRLAYYLLAGPRGRRTLAAAAGLSEMTTRTALARMQAVGWVAVDRRGTRLTPVGRAVLGPPLALVKGVVGLPGLEVSDHRPVEAALVAAAPARPAWWYRDQAVRSGADLLILLRHAGGTFRFPETGEPLGAANPRDCPRLAGALPQAASGDTLLLVGGPGRAGASAGLWAAVAGLLAPSSGRA
ncbi:MAG: hypothetical protein ACP5G2_00400 [Candidatus Bipolaricaulaceae bacterium]